MGTTLISNDTLQNVIVSWLKTRSLVTNELVDADEIKEDQYGSTAYAYPGVRVRLISNIPQGRPGCLQECTFGVRTFTEDASSRNADRITGIIANEVHNNQFSFSGTAVGMIVTNLVPAIHLDERTWMSEVLVKANIR